MTDEEREVLIAHHRDKMATAKEPMRAVYHWSRLKELISQRSQGQVRKMESGIS